MRPQRVVLYGISEHVIMNALMPRSIGANSLLVLLVSLAIPFAVSAQTLTDLRSQLADLAARLAGLQSGVTQSAPAPTALQCPSLARTLSRSMRGTDVAALQRFLVAHGSLAAGNDSGFYGPLTEAAVKQFQCTEMRICSGSAAVNGYGVAGPKTRAQIAVRCRVNPAKSVTATTTPPVTTPVTIVPGGGGVPAPVPEPAGSVGTCVALPPETQTLACPGGQVGAITQVRSSSCTQGVLPVWGAWQTTSNTCATPVPPVTTSTIQPASVPTKSLMAIGGNTPLLDYLIQDVCVNADDEPIPGDPVTCTTHRDLRFGEFVPYLRAAWHDGAAQVASISYPTQAPDGSLLIMKTMEYGGNTPAVTAFNDWRVTPWPVDSFDIVEANGTWSSIIATQEPAGGVNTITGDATGFQRFWTDRCAHEDAWPLIPMAGLSTQDDFIAKGWISPTCPSTFGESLTTWTKVATPFTYTSGKTLDSIIVTHLWPADPVQTNAVEVFYLTKEYGNARWEAWNPTGTPETSCTGEHQKTIAGKTMYMVDCHDWTRTTDFPRPINPLTNPMGKEMVFSKNMLAYGDFSEARLAPWQAWTAATIARPLQDTETKNYSMQLSCPTGCANEGIRQEVDISALTGAVTLRVGGMAKADSAAPLAIALFLLDQHNRVIGQKVFEDTMSTSWKHVGGTHDWNFTTSPATRAIVQVYLSHPAAVYTVDDIYLVPSR